MKQTNEVISNHRLGQPITKREEDCYRADDVAKHLAQAIWQLGREGAAVIGLEGAWGVGKSSLLNLLEQHLKTTRGKRITL
ncbi:P-loop NTPase fold protein [Enterobacter hormaechei]